MARSDAGLSICQLKFTLDILTDSGFLGAKLVRTPIEQNLKLTRDAGSLLPDPTMYRRLIGRLLYLTIISPGQGLFYSAASLLHLKAFTNFDREGCADTRRSITRILCLSW